jgi:hypothetical protein
VRAHLYGTDVTQKRLRRELQHSAIDGLQMCQGEQFKELLSR